MDVPALIASPVGTVSTVSRAAPVAPVSAGLAARPSSQRGERSTLTAHLGLAVAAACSWSVHKRGRAAVKGPKRVQMRYTSMCKDSDPEDSMRRRFEAVVAEAQEKICKAIEDAIAGDLGLGAGPMPGGWKMTWDMTLEELAEKQYKELQNGRLAMLAFAGMATQYLVTGHAVGFADDKQPFSFIQGVDEVVNTNDMILTCGAPSITEQQQCLSILLQQKLPK